MAAVNIQDGVSDDFDYEHWAPMVKTRLVENGVWDVVQNGVSPNPTKVPELAATIKVVDLAQWRNRVMKDNKALKIMQSSLPDSVFRKTISVASSKDLWDLLKKGNDSVEAKQRRLEKQFEKLMMSDRESMDSYLKRVWDIIQRFKISGNPKSDDELIPKLLSSLSRSYNDSIPVLKEFMTLPYLTHHDLLKVFEMFGSHPKTMPDELKKFIAILRKEHSERMWCELMMSDRESMDSYLERVWDIIERFESSGNPKSDDELVPKLLSSLSRSYDNVIPVLKEFMTLPDLTHRDLLKVFEMFGSHPKTMPDELKKFIAILRKAHSERMCCGVCEKDNHNVPRVVNSSGAGQFRGQCFQCGGSGHYARDCCNARNMQPVVTQQAQIDQKRIQKPEHLMLAVTFGALTFDENMWMVYTTASNHMTPYVKFFVTLDRSYRGRVGLADGRVIMAEGKGDVMIMTKEGKKRIKNVLFVPGINRNVLSVGQMADRGCSVTMGGRKCIIKDPTGKVFGEGMLDERGYSLRLKVIKT